MADGTDEGGELKYCAVSGNLLGQPAQRIPITLDLVPVGNAVESSNIGPICAAKYGEFLYQEHLGWAVVFLMNKGK
jgi:hypothetical protein